MKEHIGWKTSVYGRVICWSQILIIGKAETQTRWPSAESKKWQSRKFVFVIQNTYMSYSDMKIAAKIGKENASILYILPNCTVQRRNAQLPLPFWGLLTHPQRAVETDVQSWWFCVTLAILNVGSVETEKVVLPKYILLDMNILFISFFSFSVICVKDQPTKYKKG